MSAAASGAGRGAASTKPAWMGSAVVPYGGGQAPAGMQTRTTRFGDRYVGPGGHVIHLEERFLDSEPISLSQGGQQDNRGQLCRACGQDGHIAFECPVLRDLFKAGKVTREGHPK